jgi:hypothetical protein
MNRKKIHSKKHGNNIEKKWWKYGFDKLITDIKFNKLLNKIRNSYYLILLWIIKLRFSLIRMNFRQIKIVFILRKLIIFLIYISSAFVF